MLGLRFCARAFSSCGKRGPLFIAARGPLTTAASLVADHRLQTRRLSNCGLRTQLLCGMWDLPRPGLESVSPALAGRLSTTAPPGKPSCFLFQVCFFFSLQYVVSIFTTSVLFSWMIFPTVLTQIYYLNILSFTFKFLIKIMTYINFSCNYNYWLDIKKVYVQIFFL